MEAKDSFMQYIELHERAWGMDKYPDRPSLQQLLTAPVVAFWYLYDKRESRYIATLHKDLAELNAYVSRIVVHNSKVRMPERRLTKLFVNRKPVIIRGVRLLVSETENKDG